jgi:hypothetical protein
MSSYFDLKGTTLDSFKIGKDGPTLSRSGSNIIKLNNTQQILIEGALHPGYLPNSWYVDSILFDAFTALTTSMTANTVSYYPFQICRTVTLGTLAFNQTNGASTGLFRFGIYSTSSSLFLPETLITSSTEISLASAGQKGYNPTGITLTPGWYWKALNINTGTSSFSAESSYPAVSFYLGKSTFGTTITTYGYRNALTYTNATLPTIAPINSLTEITTGYPIMFFKSA